MCCIMYMLGYDAKSMSIKHLIENCNIPNFQNSKFMQGIHIHIYSIAF
jgi:hypothetical protein